jgi:prepilin-type processing-associated H-X9-DG protein
MGTLRQWGIGYVLYSQDHDGTIPWEGSRDEPDRPDAWYNGVAATLSIDGWTAMRRSGREVRAGLLDSLYVCPAAPKRPDVRPYWGYGMNYMLINTRGAYGLPARPKRRLSSIPRLGQTVFMTDKGATPDLLQSHPTANPHYDFKSYWHRGGSNVLFGDGHCAWYPGSRLLDAFQTRSRALDPELIWVPDAQFR